MTTKPKDYGIIDDRTEIPPYDDKGEPVKPWLPPRRPDEKITGTPVKKEER